MSYQVFYCFDATKEEVPAEAAVPMELADIYTALGKLERDGDFLGVVDTHGTTLQVLYNADEDSYWIEIPRPEKQGSFGRDLDFDTVTEIFKALPDSFCEDEFAGFEFQAW